MGDLSKNFDSSEFECRCGKCGENSPDPELVTHLQRLRDVLGLPIILTSGIRCLEYNKEVDGSENSEHLPYNGTAADVKTDSEYHRFILVKRAIEIGFTRIRLGKDFTHLGIRQGPKIGLYKNK